MSFWIVLSSWRSSLSTASFELEFVATLQFKLLSIEIRISCSCSVSQSWLATKPSINGFRSRYSDVLWMHVNSRNRQKNIDFGFEKICLIVSETRPTSICLWNAYVMSLKARKVLWVIVSFKCLLDLLCMFDWFVFVSNALIRWCCLGAWRSKVAASLDGGFKAFRMIETTKVVSWLFKRGESLQSEAL